MLSPVKKDKMAGCGVLRYINRADKISKVIKYFQVHSETFSNIKPCLDKLRDIKAY